MEVYLIRHGIAAERGTYKEDELRPLTDEGRLKTTKIAQRIYQIGVRFDLILTSPLIRAKETAEIMQKAGLGEQMMEFLPLAPNGDFQEWLNWWLEYKQQQKSSYLAIVGHQPDLGEWAETLVWGSSQEKLELKKAGVIGVKLPETEKIVGKCQLFLLTSPKWLI